MIIIIVALLVLTVSPKVHAADCIDVFSTGVQTNPPRLVTPTFQFSFSGSSLSGSNLSLAAGDYQNITVSNNGSATFTDANNTYRLNQLRLNNNAQANFEPGDYYINSLILSNGADIILTSPGTVRIYSNSISIGNNANIAVGDNYLVMVGYGSVALGTGVDFDGTLHVAGALSTGNNVTVNGAFNIAGGTSFGNGFTINYNTDYINNADYDGMCEVPGPPSLILHYEFNEGTGQSVADSSGNGQTATLGSSASTESTDPTWVCTDNGFAMEFDRTNSTRLFTSSFDPPPESTVAFWYKIPAEVTQTQRIFGVTTAWELRVAADDRFLIDLNTSFDNDMTSSGPQTTTDTWIHVAIRNNANTNDWAIFINGVLDNSGNDPQTDQGSGTLSLGTRTGTSDYWTGTIDDFRIYDGELSDADIAALASTPPIDNCGPPQAVAYYAMEEASWGAVIDQIGGYNGTAFNGANTVGNATCRYGEFDGVNDYVEIPHSPALNGTGALTYVAYIRPDSWTGVDQIIAKSVHGGGSGRAQMGIFSEGGVFKGRAETAAGRYEITAALPATAGDWVQVALVFDGTSLTLYQDAVVVASTNFTSTTLNQNTDPVNISKRVGSNEYYFDGLIDEVRIYTQALTGQDILDLYNSITPCPLNPALEYIELTTDGTALTCTSETVTLRACANADCSSVASEDVVVTLSSTGNANWSTNPITIPANSVAGIDVELVDRTAETVTIGVTSSNPAATGPAQCSNGTCQVTFNEAGFILSLPDQSSCQASTLSIQAVRLSDNGVSCAPAYTGDQSVNFSYAYLNPGTGSTIPELDSSPLANSPGANQTRTVNFDANASADLDLIYDDAGQLTITVSDAADNGLSTANVNTTFTPAQLLVFTNDANSACAGPNYGVCSAFRTAGTPGSSSSEFDLVVAGACADNTVTPNFTMNAISLSANLVAPLGGTNANLGVPSVDITTNGTATINQTISEVGAFSITATPGNYFGNAIPAATSTTIGRFTPYRFVVSDNSPMLDDATCDFTYQDQPAIFAPGLAPEITITAVNSAGATTLNYGGDGVANNDFWKLESASYGGRTYNNQATPYPGVIVATTGLTTTAGQTDYDGVHTISFDDDTITHAKAGAVPQPTNDAPFDSQVLLTLLATSLTDGDGIFYDPDDNGSADDYQSSVIDGTNIRWGRWLFENGFGSELQALTMNATAQYYDGTQFITAATDNCTAATTVSLSDYAGNLTAGETTESQTAITAGIIPISLTAPGLNNTGSVLLTLTTPAWLQYDYDGDGSLEDAQATATFGIFEGRRPVIIRRQAY
jgi:MSHA biogenesis protein MshQ